jgi:hypothetical protein
MSPPQLEAVLLFIGSDDVDDSRSVLLLVQALKHKEITFRSIIVHEIVGLSKGPYHKGIGLFANFTLEGFPVVRREVDTLLHLLFDVEPCSQTIEVNESH